MPGAGKYVRNFHLDQEVDRFIMIQNLQIICYSGIAQIYWQIQHRVRSLCRGNLKPDNPDLRILVNSKETFACYSDSLEIVPA